MSSDYTTSPCRQFELMNLGMVHREINFSRSVLFMAEIDLSEIEAIRSQCSKDTRPSYTAFVAKAVGLSLKEFPYANRRLYRPFGLPFLWRYQNFTASDIAIAIEVDLDDIHSVAYMEVLTDTDRRPLTELTEQLRQFSSSREASPQWQSFSWVGLKVPRPFQGLLVSLPLWIPSLWRRYRGAASMISSPAKYGVDSLVTSWSHPLSFSFGLAQEKALAVEGEVVARPAFTFCMNFDRRIMAGAQAARFFNSVCEKLRKPQAMEA